MKITEQEKIRFTSLNEADQNYFASDDLELDNNYGLRFEAYRSIRRFNSIEPAESEIKFGTIWISNLIVVNEDNERVYLTDEQTEDLDEQIKELINSL